MPLAHMVIYAIDSTFQIGEVAFYGVGGNADSVLVAGILADSVIDLVMSPLTPRAPQDSGCIRHQVRLFIHHLVDDRSKILRCYLLPQMMGLDTATTLLRLPSLT